MKLKTFDELKVLTKEEISAYRKKVVQELIDSAPEDSKRRLNGLQFQVEGIISTSSNPLSATIKISKMMHDSLGDLRGALNGTLDTNVKSECKVIKMRGEKC